MKGLDIAENELSDLLIPDIWELLPAGLRKEFVARRMASPRWGVYERQDSDGWRYEPLRPVVIEERAYRRLELVLARLLQLAVEACQRRASTLGELHRALRFPHELPLMDPDRPLVGWELIRQARPDILIEQGRPRIVEFNNNTRPGGIRDSPRLAKAYAQLCPPGILRVPPSTVSARSAALARTLGGDLGHGNPRRLLIPAYWTVDSTGRRHRHDKVSKQVAADVRRVGLEVVRADLAELRLDAAGRLLAAEVPIDLVLLHMKDRCHIVDAGGGFEALRDADRARTVQFFPRPESELLSSKAVLAWLHQDCDLGLLAGADRDLVRTYIPHTTCLGLNGKSAAPDDSPHRGSGERDRLIVKPAVGNSGSGVLFGSLTSEQDWRSATVHAARHSPVVLQHRVEPDRITMPFLGRESGRQVVAQVPIVLSPFMIDLAAASVFSRHPGPDVSAGDVVISVGQGGTQNTALLADHPERPLPSTAE